MVQIKRSAQNKGKREDHPSGKIVEVEYETKSFLGFGEGEEEFRRHVSNVRLERPGFIRLDTGIFIVVAGVMALGPKRMTNAGHAGENPIIYVALAFHIACIGLYLYRGANATINRLLNSLRIPVHVAVFTISACLFYRHAKLPRMSNVCSVIWADGVAIEAFGAYLLWLAMYPIVAGMPLSISVILEILTTLLLTASSAFHCDLDSVDCKNAYPQYISLQRTAATIANSLPFGITISELEMQKTVSCLTIISFLKISINTVFFFYMMYRTELNTRQSYAIETGKLSVAQELSWRRPALWQTFGEVVLALIVAYHTTSLGAQWYHYVYDGQPVVALPS